MKSNSRFALSRGQLPSNVSTDVSTIKLRHLAIAAILLGVFSQSLSAEEILNAQPLTKLALVIGNSHYKDITPLPNPVRDAKLVSKQLKKLGFTVKLGVNLKLRDMKRVLRQFEQKIKPNSVAVFYYAGHGVQYNAGNYLIPIDADIKKPYEVEFNSIDLGMVLSALDQSSPALSVAFIDACRNNPYVTRGVFRKKDAAGGLAPVISTAGSIISFATEPGTAAVDGTGKNSPYTLALVNNLRKPGQSVQEMLNSVGLTVMSNTSGRQKPWYSSSPTARFCFAGCKFASHAAQVKKLESAVVNADISAIRKLTRLTQYQEDTLDVLFANYHAFKANTLVSAGNKTSNEVTIQIIEAINNKGNRILPSQKWAYLRFELKPDIH